MKSRPANQTGDKLALLTGTDSPLHIAVTLVNSLKEVWTAWTQCFVWLCKVYHYHHQQSLNRKGRWGTTDDFATSFLHISLFCTALWDLENSRPVHSLMSSSHLFLCPPGLLPPFTVPCKMVLARPDEWETWSYHCSLRLFTIVRRSSCGSWQGLPRW